MRFVYKELKKNGKEKTLKVCPSHPPFYPSASNSTIVINGKRYRVLHGEVHIPDSTDADVTINVIVRRRK
jgi:hypothetical protein